MTVPGWNHNIHHHGLVLSAVPAGARRGLDVGCGEGLLASRLREIMPDVTGIDADEQSILAARQAHDQDGIEFVHGDFRTAELAPGSFDFVCCVAMLHHVDATAALRRMRELLRPGGSLAVIGLARSAGPADLAMELASSAAHQTLVRLRTWQESAAPTALPPPETYAGMRRISVSELPGSQFRRRLLWRYSLIWTKPAG